MNDEKLIPGSIWRKLLGLLRSEFSFQTGGALYQLSETWLLCSRGALCLLVLTIQFYTDKTALNLEFSQFINTICVFYNSPVRISCINVLNEPRDCHCSSVCMKLWELMVFMMTSATFVSLSPLSRDRRTRRKQLPVETWVNGALVGSLGKRAGK